jgi:hypothetical protein
VSKAPNAAGDKAGAMDKDKGASSSPADQAAKKTWTKEEAKKSGITDDQFKAADVNHDGKLDEQELNAAGLLPKK